MDFFSKLGTKAGETFQTIKDSDATKKAKNYAEIPGLTVQVGKQESLLKKAYQEIGEAYYHIHKDDAMDSFAPMMDTVTQTLQKIEQLKAEIEEKKKYDPAKDRESEVASAEETARATVVVQATEVVEAAGEVEETVAESVEKAAEIAETVAEAVETATENPERKE